LLGDVTGDWDQSFGQKKPAMVQNLVWTDEIKIDSDRITIPIKMTDQQDIMSWQLHLKFDPTILQFERAEKGNAAKFLPLIENSNDGNLYLGSYSVEAIHSDESYANVTFKILETISKQIEIEVPYFQVNNNPAHQGRITLDINNSVPNTFALLQNYPNPFNPSTLISYQVPQAGQVKMVIYNLAGQEIITLEDRDRQPGVYQVEWHGLDQAGSEVVSGVYFCHLHYGDKVKTIKLMKVK